FQARRFVMSRRRTDRKASYLGRRSWWLVGLLAAGVVSAAVVRPPAAAEEKNTAGTPAANPGQPGTDRHGDGLPTGALARRGTPRSRHGGAVIYVAFTPDGKALLTAGQDNTVRLWELKTGKEIRRFGKERPEDAAAGGGLPGRAVIVGGNGVSVGGSLH